MRLTPSTVALAASARALTSTALSRASYTTTTLAAPHHATHDATPVKHYLNLSNGLEMLDALRSAGVPHDAVSFCRFQSSQCEAGDFAGVLASVDHSMMAHLALGYEVRVYDFGSRRSRWITEEGSEPTFVPRALWWGLEWARYALNDIWHLPAATEQPPILRGHNVEALFQQQLRKLTKAQRKRVKYYRGLTAEGLRGVRLRGYYARAETDGDKEAHRLLFHRFGHEETARLELGAQAFDPEVFGMKPYDAHESAERSRSYLRAREERIRVRRERRCAEPATESLDTLAASSEGFGSRGRGEEGMNEQAPVNLSSTTVPDK